MTKQSILVFFLLLCANVVFASVPSVLLLSERHRTEWNWVEYWVTLKNTSSEIVFNPEIRYYAQEAVLEATVDFSTQLYPVTAAVSSVDGTSIVKLNVNGMLLSGDSVEIHFRIDKEGFQSAWNSSQDWSYQHNESVVEPHYFMVVYDGYHNLLWGFDPLHGKKNANVILWNERGVNSVVERYAGDTTEFIPTGRFWLFKDFPLSLKEREILEQSGIIRYDVGRHLGKDLILFKSDSDVRKAYLDSVLYGFYNAISVNDTTRLSLDVSENSTNDTLPLIVGCWPDVDIANCIGIVQTCGGENVEYARNDVLVKMLIDSIQCIEKNSDVYFVLQQYEGVPLNDNSKFAINLSDIQNTAAFLSAMNDSTTTKWLNGVDYTGEGIVVGVYDTGIDFSHPDFQEKDSSRILKRRIIERNEYFGAAVYGKVINKNNSYKSWHGSGVAGIIGGNGTNSRNRVYRGIAPKVHFFFSGRTTPYWQIGHVVNHSHIDSVQKNGVYIHDSYIMDKAIFDNWKIGCLIMNENCAEGDTLTKTVVYAASNSGGFDGKITQDVQKGFHSVLANSKNAITVGNITSKEGVRFYTSGMGPTWDGRIKPDVMAPGATSEILVNQENPFEILIDYVKLFRAGETLPYMVLDFSSNRLSLDSANLHSSYRGSIVNPNVNNDSLFQLGANEPNFTALYNGWKFDNRINVLSTDELEIRMKVAKGTISDNIIYGSIYFGTHESSFYNPQGGNSWFEFINTIWNVDSNFVTTHVKLDLLPDSLDAYFMRLDFGLVKGVITPYSCQDDSCGYAYLNDGGTSESAPQVTGLAALMYQKFKKCTGEPLDKKSMRNSTVKSIIIHSAVDMEDSENAHFEWNPDITFANHDGNGYFTPYGKGPDFATGWGKIDAKASLETIGDYNQKTKDFPRFKEFEIANGVEKRWNVYVNGSPEKMRATLVWDDAPGIYEVVTNEHNFLDSKLMNDLDMYLVSPSGRYYYPWKLDPLPTDFIDTRGNFIDDFSSGLEKIRMQDVRDAYNNCSSSNLLDSLCFDHLNNVEVVDVENPENGTWQVVVRGKRISYGNNETETAQIASLVSDFELEKSQCQIIHDYAAQSHYECEYLFDGNSANYVTFAESTFVGTGDTISLYDASESLLGKYVADSLAGKKLKVKSTKLKVVLDSDNDGVQGWGFGVSKIESIPYSILKMPFEFVN
ncbi:S8 family serine peptidase [Fibrobacter sp.]|uniref:S8 family serine peptidase n=1 Tax=Fibrobacter sp. TaxID=35828 RepID=UPI002621B20E|nr:S8 family serine peptidase [Fibrobacter sp.]MDD5943321.1 S8 family serine peptidase [Fibrobacter sp.]